MRSARFTTLASILALLAACGGGGSDSGGSAPPFTRASDANPTPTPDHRGLLAARAAGLGRGAIARMVSVSRAVAGHARSVGLCHGRRLYRCADRHRAGAVEGPLLHLPDLDRRGECVLQFGLERGLRDPLVLRFRRPAGCSSSKPSRAPRRSPPASTAAPRYWRSAPARRRCAPWPRSSPPRRRRGQRGARAVGRGGRARAALHQRRGRARGQRDQGRFRHLAGLVALRRQDLRRWGPPGRLSQPAHLHLDRRSAIARRLRPFPQPGGDPADRRLPLQWRRAGLDRRPDGQSDGRRAHQQRVQLHHLPPREGEQ